MLSRAALERQLCSRDASCSSSKVSPVVHFRCSVKTTRATGSNNGSGPGSYASIGSRDEPSWANGIPSYLQNSSPAKFPCAETMAPPGGKKTGRELSIWETIRREAQTDASSEPLLSSFLYASILAHDTFERALAFVLANRLANTTMLPTQLFELFYDILSNDVDVRCGALADVEACRDRDPACHSLTQALLYYKGYHAIQTHRIAHALWMRGQKVIALALQSRMSEVFAVDIHPAARIGKGILLDHGTGVVIGETAVIGDNCSLLQNVTLGGTGKETGDRHPKVSENVLIGASATILGNIKIGEGAQIAAGSLVLKEVTPHAMVAGSPAKEVGRVKGNPASTMLQWAVKTPSGSSMSVSSAADLLLNSIEDPDEASRGTGAKSSSKAKPPVATAAAAATAGPAAPGVPPPSGTVLAAAAAAKEASDRAEEAERANSSNGAGAKAGTANKVVSPPAWAAPPKPAQPSPGTPAILPKPTPPSGPVNGSARPGLSSGVSVDFSI